MDFSALSRRFSAVFAALSGTVFAQILALSLRERLENAGAHEAAYLLPQALYPLLNLLLLWGCLRIVKVDLRPQIRIRTLKIAEFLPWLGVFAGVCGGLNFLSDRLFPAEGTFLPEGPLQTVVWIVAVGILTPICEEILCRATLCCPQMRHTALLSAGVFAVLHLSPAALPFAFGAGLILALCYLRTGNFLYPMLLHILNNLWALLFRLGSAAGWPAVASDGANLFWVIVALPCAWILFRRRTTEEKAPSVFPMLLRNSAFWIFAGVYGFLILWQIFF